MWSPEINKILKHEGHDFWLASIIASMSWKTGIPRCFLKQVLLNTISQNPKDDKFKYVNIFMLSAQMGTSDRGLHAVTLMHHNDIFAYSDPLKEEFEILDNIEDLFDKCEYIVNVESFYKEEGFIIWDGDKLGVMEIFTAQN